MTRGDKKGLWRAWIEDDLGHKSHIQYYATKEQADESFDYASISKTRVAQSFRKTKVDIQKWAEMSKLQVKELSEKYR